MGLQTLAVETEPPEALNETIQPVYSSASVLPSRLRSKGLGHPRDVRCIESDTIPVPPVPILGFVAGTRSFWLLRATYPAVGFHPRFRLADNGREAVNLAAAVRPETRCVYDEICELRLERSCTAPEMFSLAVCDQSSFGNFKSQS